MPVHPEHLRRAVTAPTIVGDRTCNGCGYQLRGLPAGARCPECGLPQRGGLKSDDPLSLMPLEMIRAFRLACTFASTIVLTLIVTLILERVLSIAPAAFTTIVVALTVLWMPAVWLLTPAFQARIAQGYGFSAHGRERLVARWTSPGWALAAGAWAFGTWAPTIANAGSTPQILRIAMLGGLALGAASLVALLVLLYRLAEWTRDREAAGALNFTLFGVPIATVIVLIPYPMWVLQVLAGLLWVVAAATFPWGLLSLSRSVSWAVRHAHEQHDRERRRKDRDDEFSREMVERSRRSG